MTITRDRSQKSAAARAYDAHKDRVTGRQAAMVAAGQDIGPVPPVANVPRRRRAAASLCAFCQEYFREIFYLPWSKDQLRVIGSLEYAINHGGLRAIAMPRGSGKSVLARIAALWAILTGRCRYVCLIAATADRGKSELAKVQTACETNADLQADWPEALYPVARLERITQRQRGQTYRGRHTRITWLDRKIVFPTIAGSPCSASIITCAGLTGADIRGQSHATADGEILRPDLAILDDPQTTESAHSTVQSARREALLAGDVLGMAGPGRKIAAVVCCTVINPGDMADNILDRDKHPEWNGERTKMVYSFPTNEKLWDQYAKIRAESLAAGRGMAEATEFYRRNRRAMDAGAEVAWPERFDPGELSGLQHAMNLKLQDEAAFWAEYQNDPQPPDHDEDLLTADLIAAKLNNRPYARVPAAADHLIAAVDVQKKALFWNVMAFQRDFTACLIDYGTYPDQKRTHFSLRDIRRTLATAHRGKTEEAALYAGLGALADILLGREWKRDDGSVQRVEAMAIDAGYQTDTVHLFCRQYASPAVRAYRGLPVTASSSPLCQRKRHKGERLGADWRLTSPLGRHHVRELQADVNIWKSFLHARLAAGVGAAGCLSLWGSSAARHRLYAEHLTAETPIHTEGRGRVVNEWKLPPSKPDNHWLDTSTACMVAASVLGCRLIESTTTPGALRRRRKRKATYI